MPLEPEEGTWQSGKQEIVTRLRAHADVAEDADLWPLDLTDLSAASAGQQLATEADAEHRRAKIEGLL